MFSRNPKEFHDCIKRWTDNEDIKRRIGDECIRSRLPSEAYILAPAMWYEYIQKHIGSNCLTLGPGHVIVHEELEQSLMEAVRALPRKFKISVQSRGSIIDEHEPPDVTQVGETSGYGPHDTIQLQIVRTFMQVKVPSSLYSAPSDGPRTASTTDASLSKGPNPRGSVRRH